LALGNPAIESVGLKLAGLLKVNHTSTLLIVSSFVGLFWSFWKMLLLERDTPRKPKAAAPLKEGISMWFWITCVLIIFLSFPALSTDVFDYNNTNRVAFIHDADPWQYPAD